MSDLDVLRELVRRLPPPTYDDLVTVARKRRRRSALGAAAGAAVVVLAVVMAGAALPGGQRTLMPADHPSPAQSESPSSEEWTLERIRAEGSPGDEMATTESGLAARPYFACAGTRCEGDFGPPDDMHVALEVTQEGRSALFDVRGAKAWATVYDADSVLVQDAEGQGVGQPVRYRLLQADGTEVPLRVINDPAPPVAGRDLFVIDDFSGWSVGMDGVEDVYLVDDRAGTLRPLDVPEEDVRYWGPNVDEFLWGVTSDCRVFWGAAGTLKERRLECSKGVNFTFMHDEWFPEGWLQPGRMAVAEQLDDRMVIHVSLDSGATWQRIPVRDDNGVADVLRKLG